MNMATEYGSRLKKARNHAGLTQVELSKKTGIPQSTISTAERIGNGSGETPVYAQACGVDALWLATGNGEMLPPPAQLPVPTQNKATSTTSVEDGAINSGATLGQTLDRLGQLLEKADAKTRNDVAALLLRYAQDPAQGKRLAQAIEILLSGAN